jgi:hypothetical protein
MGIADWLKGLGLAQYATAFRENDITEALLPDLTAGDLKDLGVTTVGHRRTLLKAIAALPRETASSPAAPGSHAAVAAPEPQAERRQLSVMFCDLVGSTALSARLDPEDLRAVIGAYHRCVAGIIERAGGFVAKSWATGCSPISAIRGPTSTMPSARYGPGWRWSRRWPPPDGRPQVRAFRGSTTRARCGCGCGSGSPPASRWSAI